MGRSKVCDLRYLRESIFYMETPKNIKDEHAALTKKKETAATAFEKDSGKQPNIGKCLL